MYRCLRQEGNGLIQFIPVVERMPDGTSLAPWSVEPEQFGTFLCAIFDEWVRRDVGAVYVQLFDVALEC